MRISDWSSDVCSSDLRAPRVPETVVGVEIAVVHLAVIRAVVDDLAGRVLLEEFARELQHPVKRRIEGAAVVLIGVVYADAREFSLPSRLGLDRTSTRLNSRH